MVPTLTDCIPEQFKFERVKSRSVIVNAPVAAIGLAMLVRQRRKALKLILMAIAFMLLAFPVIFFA